MKKPLGYSMYFKGNKKAVTRYISTLIITAIILAIIQIIITNLGEELKKSDGLEDYYISIYTKDGNLLGENEINKIKELQEVKYLIPKKSVNIEFTSFVGSPNCNINFMSNSDIEKFFEALNIKYDKEKIKSLEKNKTLVTYRKEKNGSLKKVIS